MHFPAPPRPARPAGTGGRPPRHGPALKLSDPQTWPGPAVATVTGTTRYGTATAMAWGRLHQRLASRCGWENHHGELPVIESTLISEPETKKTAESSQVKRQAKAKPWRT